MYFLLKQIDLLQCRFDPPGELWLKKIMIRHKKKFMILNGSGGRFVNIFL